MKIRYKIDATKAWGTLKSAVVSVKSDNFIARDITFENTSPSPLPVRIDLLQELQFVSVFLWEIETSKEEWRAFVQPREFLIGRTAPLTFFRFSFK
ncbi:hypothetical protein R1flu_003989 [Riccia fluitans]|uniref:Uncharacterized protein n=1 Tax=Riccia fluitans TaxID=41844 RepID=A0ABD1YP13_9MARC